MEQKDKVRLAKSLIQLRFGDPSVKPVKVHNIGDIICLKEVHGPKSDAKRWRDEWKRLLYISRRCFHGKGSTLMNTQCLFVLLTLETQKSKSLGKMYFENFHLWAVCGHIKFKSHK